MLQLHLTNFCSNSQLSLWKCSFHCCWTWTAARDKWNVLKSCISRKNNAFLTHLKYIHMYLHTYEKSLVPYLHTYTLWSSYCVTWVWLKALCWTLVTTFQYFRLLCGPTTVTQCSSENSPWFEETTFTKSLSTTAAKDLMTRYVMIFKTLTSQCGGNQNCHLRFHFTHTSYILTCTIST